MLRALVIATRQVIEVMADWRLENVDRLKGLALRRQKYTRWSDDWDHDHCAGCWAKFMESGGPDTLQEGYATCEDYRFGARYEWICPKCFSDLKTEMEWSEAD